jgi:hypothetical protein
MRDIMEDIYAKVIISMYLQDKLSVSQIGDQLGVSTKKVDYILKKYGVQKRSISEAITQINITRFHKIPSRPKENLSLEEVELKIAGIMLYWGEGAKTNGSVGLANSNPEIIELFLLFLRKICGVHEARIKAGIHMYPDQDEEFLLGFWSGITAIPRERFYKSQLLAGKKGTYKYKSLYGTATIFYCDTKLLHMILGWIDEYKNKILNMPE